MLTHMIGGHLWGGGLSEQQTCCLFDAFSPTDTSTLNTPALAWFGRATVHEAFIHGFGRGLHLWGIFHAVGGGGSHLRAEGLQSTAGLDTGLAGWSPGGLHNDNIDDTCMTPLGYCAEESCTRICAKFVTCAFNGMCY